MGGIESSVGRPVRGQNFFDREDEQRLLWQHLRQSHILLLAPRRVGKTSLLFRLMDDARQHDRRAVYVSVADARSEDDIVRKLLTALANHPESDALLKRLGRGPFKRFFSRLKGRVAAGPLSLELAPAEAPSWASLAEAATEAIERAGERWLVLVDELPIFVMTLLRQDQAESADGPPRRTRDFLNWFRQLRNVGGATTSDAARDEASLRWILAGSIGLDSVVARARLGDTINDLRVFPLGAFSPAVADHFLAALGDSYGLPLDAPTRARLAERAGWLIPFYLQVLFSRLHDLAAEASLRPSPALVDRVVEELLTPTYRAYFDYWRQRLTEELGRPDDQRALALLAVIAPELDGAPREALQRVAAGFEGLTASQRDESLRFLLEVLENDGYIVSDSGERAPQSARFRFRSNLLREYWLRRVIA
ncbi:MAG: AAA family ATPase [Deltaproteobacteria bacterium]|nr:AAA family ATPase [Deltaproteobacteria bacterium]